MHFVICYMSYVVCLNILCYITDTFSYYTEIRGLWDLGVYTSVPYVMADHFHSSKQKVMFFLQRPWSFIDIFEYKKSCILFFIEGSATQNIYKWKQNVYFYWSNKDPLLLSKRKKCEVWVYFLHFDKLEFIFLILVTEIQV